MAKVPRDDAMRRLEAGEKVAPGPQMTALREMLDDAGIAWTDQSDFMFCRTQSADEENVLCFRGSDMRRARFSVICGEYSYGGGLGLLECWTYDMAGPEGWLDADEAMRMIRECLGLG